MYINSVMFICTVYLQGRCSSACFLVLSTGIIITILIVVVVVVASGLILVATVAVCIFKRPKDEYQGQIALYLPGVHHYVNNCFILFAQWLERNLRVHLPKGNAVIRFKGACV